MGMIIFYSVIWGFITMLKFAEGKTASGFILLTATIVIVSQAIQLYY